jgi:hypothetical protein
MPCSGAARASTGWRFYGPGVDAELGRVIEALRAYIGTELIQIGGG